MSVYVIGDLHLSFGADKPMDIFGDNWENHAEKIKQNWLEKVKEDDYGTYGIFKRLLCINRNRYLYVRGICAQEPRSHRQD